MRRRRQSPHRRYVGLDLRYVKRLLQRRRADVESKLTYAPLIEAEFQRYKQLAEAATAKDRSPPAA